MNGDTNENYLGYYKCEFKVTDSNSVNDQVGNFYDILYFDLTITEEGTTINDSEIASSNSNSTVTDLSVKLDWVNYKG